MKPEWAKVVTSLNNRDSKVVVAKVEAYDEKKLAEEYDVEGFPQIKFFIDGEAYDYNNERTEAQIIEFVNRMTK